MSDRERVMKELSWLIYNFPQQKDPKDAADKMCNAINTYCSDALALLKAQEPRVLTIDEVRRNREWVVWIECDYSKTQNIGQYKGRVSWHNKRLSDWERFLTIESGEYLFRESDKYGKTWRCWNARPTEEQMRDTPWKGEDNG